MENSNRWIRVVAALVIQMCLGVVYAWSIFKTPLLQFFNADKLNAMKDQLAAIGVAEPKYALLAAAAKTSEEAKKLLASLPVQDSTVQLTFTITLVFFTIGMIFAGRWQDKVGPRIVATVGGLLLGVGVFLSYFAKSPTALYITYGVIGGTGIGFAYVTPISTCVKWFPDKRGLVTGLAVFGFGFGSLLFGPLAATLITNYGVFTTFAVLGVIFAVLVAGAAQFLVNPPAGWKPAGWEPPAPAAGTAAAKAEFTPNETLASPSFWMLWVMYIIGASVGLMVISQASPMAVSYAKVPAAPPAGTSPFAAYFTATAAGAVGILALFNGLGRLAWGSISDKIGRERAVLGMYIVYIVALLWLYSGTTTSFFTYVVAISLVGTSFGGFLAVMPSLCADYFGTKNYGTNYAYLFTAYGVGAIIGPILVSKILESTGGNFAPTFPILAVLCVLGGIIALMTKSPQARAAAQTA